MFRTVVAAAVAMAAALTLLTGPVDAQPSRIELGTLTCSMSSSIGLIVGSQKNVNCIFRGRPGEPEEAYTGTMTTIGLDIGITAGGVMAWGVITPNAGPMRGKLAGKYVGASGSIGLGVGVGANVLVGGSNRAISLQPLSVEGTVGINLSLGISGLTLALAQ